MHVSPLSKEEEKENHLNLVKKLQAEETKLIYYSDDSKSDNNQLGAGVFNIRTKIKNFWNLGSDMEVFDAELYAIEKSIKLAQTECQRNKSIKDIWVFSDSQAAIKRLSANKLDKDLFFCKQIRARAQDLNKRNVQVHLHWVPAHMNIYGNEQADMAVKYNTEFDVVAPDKCVSLSFIKRKIREKALDQWANA